MMKRIAFPLIFLAIYGCGPSMHVYNTTNAPCLGTPREASANMYVGSDHSEFQVAFSPVNNLGVFANYYGSYSSSQSIGTKLYEGAVGYYQPLQDEWYFDAYAGGGYGERAYTGTPSGRWISNNNNVYYIQTFYSKFFVQPSLFYKRDKFECAFALQAAMFSFDNAYYSVLKPASDKYPYDQEFSFEYHKMSIYNFNPSVTFKFGLKNLKLTAQLATNVKSGNPFYHGAWTEGQTPFNLRVLEINTGLQFSFGGINKEQN